MNTRQKMYSTNSEIKKELIKLGFTNIYLFPHLRFMKDYHLCGCGFDAMGFKANDKHLYFFQFKTNEKPSKKVLEQYKFINENHYVKCIWANKVKRNGVVFYGFNAN